MHWCGTSDGDRFGHKREPARIPKSGKFEEPGDGGYCGVWLGSRKWIVGHFRGVVFGVAADFGPAAIQEDGAGGFGGLRW